MNGTVEAKVYLQIKPTRPSWSRTISGAALAGATQKKPEVQKPGTVLIKLKVRLPIAAFEPLQPEAVVVVPESLVQHAVEVEAIDGGA